MTREEDDARPMTRKDRDRLYRQHVKRGEMEYIRKSGQSDLKEIHDNAAQYGHDPRLKDYPRNRDETVEDEAWADESGFGDY